MTRASAGQRTRLERIRARLAAVVLLSLMGVLAGILWQRQSEAAVALLALAGMQPSDAIHIAGPVLFLVALFAAFAILHWVDRRWGGDGLSDRVLRRDDLALVSRGYRYDPQVTQGLLSKQSIFTAIAVALLIAVVSALVSDHALLVQKRSVLWAIAVAMVVTLLLAMASITCYTHALQFQWQEHYGAALVRTGSKFDMASFYLLSGSLLLGAALWQAWATYVLGLLYAVLLYWYYFFPLRRDGGD